LYGKTILKFIVRKQGRWVLAGFVWLRVETNGGLCEHGNEISGSIKGRIFLG
jgi:hypothetical protein